MNAPPDVSVVRSFLSRASRRLAWMRAAEGAVIGLAIAIGLALIGWPSAAPLLSLILIAAACVAGGIAMRLLAWQRTRAPIAFAIERRAPSCRNIVITADELASARRGDDRITEIVHREAARIVRGLDLATLFPARTALIAFAASAALWSVTVATQTALTRQRSLGRDSLRSRFLGMTGAPAGVDGLDISIVPPAYTGRPTQSVRDPVRIEALVGSRLRITVQSRAPGVAIETLGGRDTLKASGSGRFTADIQADADGYISLRPAGTAGKQAPARLIGLSVISDNAPRVRISAPGKDLFLKDAHHTIDLAIDAGDDIGLASLRVRYTKVSGSGERFTFTDGEVPIAITRGDNRTWTARASWALDGLGMEPGDLVVYRAVATDARPGSTPSESDSYIAEVLAPGGVAAPGFELDPDVERYAVSQQMVIVKTERLIARRPSMSAESFADSSTELAGEQRKVRAEFVFMTGGEVADESAGALNDLNEEQEAQGESDLLAGRMVNRGRIALLRAIRSMSRAARALTTADVPGALPHERLALTQLEQAFSHTRIILRALTERERLDLTRRLTGTLTDAVRDTRPVTASELDSRTTALRRALAGIATLAAAQRTDGGANAAVEASALAEGMLGVDPSSKPLQDVAALLARVSTSIAGGRRDEASDLLGRAATNLAAIVRAELRDVPARGSALDVDRLSGALTDALRRGRGAP